MSVLAPLYAHDPQQTAVAIGDTELGYGRLCADIDIMAAWYAGEGLKPGARIAIFCREQTSPNYWDWIMLLGAIRAGLVHSVNALPAAVSDSGAAGPLAAAVGAPGAVEKCAGDPRRLPFEPSGTGPLAEQLKPAGKLPPIKATAKAVRLFRTSGTTGIAKVVPWPEALMIKRVAEVRTTSGIGPDTRLFNFLGMVTTTSLRHTLGAWQIGAEVQLGKIGSHAVDPWAPVIASDHLVASPFRLGKLIEFSTHPLPGREKRVIELLGGRIPPKLRADALARVGCEVRNLYGSTETGMVASGRAMLIQRHPGAVGYPVEGAEIEVVDDSGAPLPRGQQGLVRMRTASMAEGYIGSDEPLERDGWFYPGDIGIIAPDGMLAIVGRAGDTINIGGATLASAPIEQKIRELDGIDEACVLDLPGSRADQVMVAVGCAKGTDLTALGRQMRPFFPKGFRIDVCRVEKMPRNEMGKIVRRDLAARIVRERQKQRGA